jgi:hypothetical protein
VKLHKWTWITAEWDTLPETLESAEVQGWEIFTVSHLGDTGRYVKVIMRRPASDEKNEE